MGQRGTRRRTGTSPKGMAPAGEAVLRGAMDEAGEPLLADLAVAERADEPREAEVVAAEVVAQPRSEPTVADVAPRPVPLREQAGRRDAARTPPPRLLASDARVASPDALAARSDPLARAPAAALMAELALHERAETPFCIGLLGPAGAGKSTFLDQVLGAAARVAAAAAGAGLATPFLAEVAVVRIDAATPGDPETLLRSAVAERLAETHPEVAETLDRAGTDPHAALEAANHAMDEARRTLDVERRRLDELGARDARLVDTVLETPGSLVDLYARTKRSGLARVQRQFGFGGGDPVVTFKALVHRGADRPGALARVASSVRALYGFPGQRRLVTGVLVLTAVAWACAFARRDEAGWGDAVRGLGERAGPVADWVAGHLAWLGTVQTAAEFLAVALLGVDVVRAARFVLPISRGIDLLQQDLEGRRRELASLIAHQTRRVDTLAADADGATRRALAAERRAVAQHAARMGVPRPAGAGVPQSRDLLFFGALRTALARPGAGPRRIVVALDGLDERPPAEAAALLRAAHRLLGPGTVTLVCADRDHLLAGFGETDPAGAAAAVARCIQVPYRVDAADGAAPARQAYAATLLEGTAGDPVPAPDPHVSRLDEPWRDAEAALVAALAPFAGPTPRAVKRFVNLYRVARADPRLRGAALPALAALALALALDPLGEPEDLAALAAAVRGERPAAPSRLLTAALAAMRQAAGPDLDPADAARGLVVAASYGGRGVFYDVPAGSDPAW